MSQFFLRTNKTEGKAPLYVRTRRKGISEEFAGHAKI